MAELTPLPDCLRTFTIDPGFRDLLPAPTAEERDLLEASILAHGVRDPGVVWRETKVLLDGHRRAAICAEHGLPFPVVEYEFPDRAAATDWIVNTALARRNLTAEQQAHLRGLRYATAKQATVANLKQFAPSDRSDHSEGRAPLAAAAGRESTAERLAREYGVSPATIRRDARFAADVDAIAASAGPEARDELLSGKLHLPRAAVRRIAAAKPMSLAEFRRMVGGPKAEPRTTARGRTDRDPVAEIDALTLRLSAAMRAYVRSGIRPGDRERLTELWELRTEIGRLATYMEGEE